MFNKAARATPWMTFIIATAMVFMFAAADGSRTLWIAPGDRGVDRAVSAFTAVLSHSDTEHLVGNVGAFVVFGAVVEVGYGRRWLAVTFATAVAHAVVFVEDAAWVSGASGWVHLLLGFAVVAPLRHVVEATSSSRPSVRQVAALIGAQFAAVVAPFAVFTDIRGLRHQVVEIHGSTASVIGHATHLRCLGFGMVIAAVVYARFVPGVVDHVRYGLRRSRASAHRRMT